jgi:hypothetical protein
MTGPLIPSIFDREPDPQLSEAVISVEKCWPKLAQVGLLRLASYRLQSASNVQMLVTVSAKGTTSPIVRYSKWCPLE